MTTAEKRTVMETMESAAKLHGDKPALRTLKGGAVDRTITWGEYRGLVRLAARSFVKLGVKPGESVSIIGFNCPQWFISDIGAIYAGAKPAGIYTTSSAEQCRYIADHSDSSVAVVEDQAQLAKFKEIRDDLPKLKAIVMMFGDDGDDDVYSWDEFLALSKDVDESELEERIKTQQADDVCTLIYTSGTTDKPKAVMISHDNITWIAKVLAQELRHRTEATDSKQEFAVDTISYLPLSHIAEQVVSLHAPISIGGCSYFAESLDALGENLRVARPTVFLGVPRVWEKIQAKITAVGANNPPLKRKIAAWARAKGTRGGFAEQAGMPKPLLWGLANKLVFTKVKQQLGLDRAIGQYTSTAPTSRDTLEFFLSLGLPLYEVYGLSECTGPATLSLPNRYRTGTAGACLPGAEIKTADDGEVCIRGRHVFKGYYKDEEATRKVIDSDGWLHSGDLGTIDSEGFLSITGRKKDLIITAGGENISPQMIEGMLQSIPAVAQAVVVGDRRRFLSALLTLDPERLESFAQEIGSKATTMAEAAECEFFQKHIMEQVNGLNKHLARVQSIKKIRLLPAEFSIDSGELTPTMKIKRQVIYQKYAKEIDALYA